MHVFMSRFYELQGNRHMQLSHLLQAERRHPMLDVAFIVFQMRKSVDEPALQGSAAGSNRAISALSRLAFERCSAEAHRAVSKSSQKQLAFWTEMLDPRPDLSRMHTLAREINDSIQQAERSFAELFLINGQSVPIMRLYASFNE